MNKYQKLIYEKGEEIFNCPNFQTECKRDLKKSNSVTFLHGPEIGFVGSLYGENNQVKVLFTISPPCF